MEKKRHRNKSDLGENFVAPDGGWGWLICIAAGISNFCCYTTVQSFGLLFRDKLIEIGLTNTEITTIANCQPALSYCTGLFNGPLFRRFSYRQVALFSSIFIFSGVFLCSFAETFVSFLISFSVIYGLATGTSVSATTIVSNIYFNKLRPRASSISCTITGLGPVLMPYLIAFLLPRYGFQASVMIISAIVLNSMACALIYQPVQWHVKKLENKNVEMKLIEKIANNNNNSVKNIYVNQSQDSKNSKELQKNKENSTLLPTKKGIKYYERISNFFEFDLFKDLTYVNLMMGLTLTNFSEINLTTLTPFFLSDFGYDILEITSVMSANAIVDIICRFLMPLLVERVKLDNRIYFLVGIFELILVRMVIASKPTFLVLLVCYGLLGIGRALRTIFRSLIIPDYVSLKRLPAAIGLQLLVAGIFGLGCGPVVGMIRDATDFKITIYFLNAISLVPIISWTGEMLYRHFHIKKSIPLGTTCDDSV